MNTRLKTFRSWGRALLKALVLFLVFDGCFILFQPFNTLQRLTIFGTIIPLRPRIVRTDVSVNLRPQIVPLETLLASHEIAAPKAADEYRVAIFGNSGIYGYGNADDQTIAAFMTQARGQVNGKFIRAYNLGYPLPFVYKDILIADASLDYNPDLLIFFVAPDDFEDLTPGTATFIPYMFTINRARALHVAAALDTPILLTQALQPDPPWWTRSILFQREAIYNWLVFQAYPLTQPPLVLLSARISNRFYPTTKVKDAIGAHLNQTTNFQALSRLHRLTKVPILIVNEPTYINPQSEQTGALNYSDQYSREGYEAYRAELHDLCIQQGYGWLDLWNSVQPDRYTDSHLHRDSAGQRIVGQAVVNFLQGQH
jgi:hypothetical protein